MRPIRARSYFDCNKNHWVLRQTPYTFLLFLIKCIAKQLLDVTCIHPALPEGDMFQLSDWYQAAGTGETQPLPAAEPNWRSGCSSVQRLWVWENVPLKLFWDAEGQKETLKPRYRISK